MLAQTITDDMTQCPRCASARCEVEGPNDVGFILFACGSQADNYSAPWWMDECYQAAGVEALTELVSQHAYIWHLYSKGMDELGVDENPFEADLHQAIEWLDEARKKAAAAAS